MSERKAGFYWVRDYHSSDWQVAEASKHGWFLTGLGEHLEDGQIKEAGPRIPTPDEMERQKLAWQAEALEALAAADRTWRKAEILAAARAIKPRPGGGDD